MDKAPGVLIANQIVPRSRPAPRLRLLIEWEPRHRVFFRNLADLLVSRRVPPLRITSRPAPFWNDVFVPAGAPWTSFLESMLWHSLLLILFVWGQSRVWAPVELFPKQAAFRHRSITYYPPAQTFRAAESRASGARARSPVKQPLARHPAHQPPMPVTPQQKPSLVTPPDIKQAAARLPNLPASHAVTPMVPFSATTGPRRNTSAGASPVVTPPPRVEQDVDQATARRLALPQASAIAPAPEIGGASTGRMKAPNTGGLRVVPPSPSVQSTGDSARAGSLSGTRPNVVPPPPSLQGAGNATGAGRLDSRAAAGSQVVPPAPSVQILGNSERSSLQSGTRPSVVPPPPAIQGAGNAAGNSRLGSMAGTGPQVVPPPPSVQSSHGPGGTRLGSLPGASSQVIPPPPSVQAGNSGTGRLDSLSGNGSQIVPPPPSVEGSGNLASGRLGSLPGNGVGDGSQVLPPPPSMGTAGNSGGSGPANVLEPMEPLPMDAASAAPGANNENQATVEELPLGLLGVVFAAPGTSFFSNFEVFVAKRRVGNDLQLIKLVYEFLPYQRRLSEYDLNNLPPRVIKLRVTPDPSCDESLGQIIQPTHTDPTSPTTEYPKLPAALRSYDMSAVLPCYRTTAGDFQKAMSRAH